MSSIQILVLSDNYALHTGLKKLFDENNIEVVGQASSSEDIEPIAYRVEPGVMLLAIDGTKEDAVTMMQRLHPWQIPVLVMSRHNDAKQVQRLLEAGARGYMLMSETPEMIVAAVRAAAGGEQWLNPHLGGLDEWPDWKRIGNQRTHGALSFGELLRQNGHLFSDRSRYLATKEGIV